MKDLEPFVFTVFEIESLQTIKEVIEERYKERFNMEKAEFVQEPFNLKNFYNPSSSASKDDVFVFWKEKKYENRILFTSNSSDGRFTLCNRLSKILSCNYFMCRMLLETEEIYPFFEIRYKRYGIEEERCVQAYKDPKWTFFEKGEPLDFEDLELYKKKYIRDRLNSDIIISYLSKYGIGFEDLGKDVQDYFITKISL